MRNHVSLPIYQLFILSAALCLGACATTSGVPQGMDSDLQARAEANGQEVPDFELPDYRIRPGDEIEILVWEQPSFNVLTTVSSTGSITMPLVGEVDVAGLTQQELNDELTRLLGDYIRDDINLTISIRNMDSLMVSIFGMVTRPDNYPVVDQISIFRLLATAGGPTENANMRRVHLYRQTGAEDSVVLDLTEYLDTGRMNDPAIMVRQGDIIYIPRKDNAVREMSEFLRDVVVLFGIFRIFN